MKNKLTDLRNHLFSALEALADEDNPMELPRARAIADVAQTIINSAKVEIDYCRLMKQTTPATDFLDSTPAKPRLVASV